MGRPLQHDDLVIGRSPAAHHLPTGIPTAWGVDIHYRSLPHGAWAGVAMATGSRRAPEYRDPHRGYYRARLQRRPGGATPMGYMSISTAFVLFPWGRVTRGHPVKWLLHITGGQPQPDPEAAEMQPGSSFTLERKPGGVTWELGGLPPKIALQYYYDWGHMQGTGAIYGRLPRSYTAPPSKWEEMGANLIPSPQSERQPPPNPNFWGYQQQEETQTTGGETDLTKHNPAHGRALHQQGDPALLHDRPRRCLPETDTRALTATRTAKRKSRSRRTSCSVGHS